jgi:hypothetical protein
MVESGLPGSCPFCGGAVVVTDFACRDCGATVNGLFNPCPFCALDREQRRFLTSFVRCRGNIKEVEKDLGISYPTVRARLDGVAKTLGFGPPPDRGARAEVLAMLERGEITADEAAEMLKEA